MIIDRELLKKYHKNLFPDAPYAGYYRQTHMELCSETNPDEVRYVAPHPDYIVPLMNSLYATIADETHLWPNMIQKAAYVYMHIIGIHPFEDGNGRVALRVAADILAVHYKELVASIWDTQLKHDDLLWRYQHTLDDVTVFMKWFDAKFVLYFYGD
jgi:fido (protein-threonine AMPylation protein)